MPVPDFVPEQTVAVSGNSDLSGRRYPQKHWRFDGLRRQLATPYSGLLNRYTVISRIVGSNPIPSAISFT
jgi:hypothetical protein